MVPATFVSIAACMVYGLFGFRILSPPTRHDTDTKIYHFFQHKYHDSRMDYHRMAFVLIHNFSPDNRVNSCTKNTNTCHLSGITRMKNSQTLNDAADSSQVPKTQGCISHMVSAQNLQKRNQIINILKYIVLVSWCIETTFFTGQ